MGWSSPSPVLAIHGSLQELTFVYDQDIALNAAEATTDWPRSNYQVTMFFVCSTY